MHQMRPVPPMVNNDSPPYFALTFSMPLTMVSSASSQLIRCQPGSSPFGCVRFMG